MKSARHEILSVVKLLAETIGLPGGGLVVL